MKNEQLSCHTNGGSQVSQKQAKFRDFGRVWFNNQSLVNILSFAKVRKTPKFKVDYNQAKNALIVTLPDKSIMPFIQRPWGLYYYGVCWKSYRCNAFAFVNTVQDNLNMFTPRRAKKAEAARSLYTKLGRPSTATFRYMVAHQLMKHCDIDVTNVDRADKIFGPNLGSLKRKTVHTAPAPVIILPPLAVP